MTQSPAETDIDVEQEVDLKSAWQRVLDHWWLPVAGAVVGGILGMLLAIGGGDTYRASALVYLGQPFGPGASGQIQSLATNPKTVSEIVRTEAALKRAAAAADMPVDQLRGKVSTEAFTQTVLQRNQSPLVEVTVDAKTKAKAEAASDSLAESVVENVSSYVANKVALLEERAQRDREGLETAQARIEAALKQQQLALDAQDLTAGERFLVLANANNVLNFWEARQFNLRADLNEVSQLQSLAEYVESSRVVEQATASRQSATSRRTAIVVGALAGLLLGALAAIVADPWLSRRKPAPA